MKRILLTLVAGLTALGLNAASSTPASGVTGTMHDLSATGPNTVTGNTQICQFCHAPHYAAKGAAQLAPLWNHATTVATYTMYNAANAKSEASSLQGTVDASPTGVSLACLSCHDGTVAVGSLLNYPYAAGGYVMSYATAKAGGAISQTTGLMSGVHAIGSSGDLTSDHPIGITYQDDKDLGLYPATGLLGVQLYPTNKTGSKVQCASCHDVHNWTLSPSTGLGGSPFLRVANTTSGLCKTCHKQ